MFLSFDNVYKSIPLYSLMRIHNMKQTMMTKTMRISDDTKTILSIIRNNLKTEKKGCVTFDDAIQELYRQFKEMKESM